jgi:hypothetical protein
MVEAPNSKLQAPEKILLQKSIHSAATFSLLNLSLAVGG